MRLSLDLKEGRFLRRLNRFAALVEVDDEETMAHVTNSGRMRELLAEGNRVLLTPAAAQDKPRRKTRFDLTLVDLGHTLVSADARLPNALVLEALACDGLPHLAGYERHLAEQWFQDSRLDLLLTRGEERHGGMEGCYVETKSVTLVERGVGLFPDAPTSRGRRHVETLARAVEQGYRAAVVFVVQRPDAHALRPNDPADPAFGIALRQAAARGVEVYAYRCRVSASAICLDVQLPVELGLITHEGQEA